MKLVWNRIGALFMAMVIAVGGCINLSGSFKIVHAAANEVAPSVSDLKLNLLEEPFGIPRDELNFSWSMVDSDSNEKQTAYRIVIGTTKENMENGSYVKDTGWISSDKSSGVEISNLSLEANHLYYWSVQIKDKENKASELSEPKAFTTAPEKGNGWETIYGIWDNTSMRASEVTDWFQVKGWTNYAVELDIQTSTALGIAFRGQNNGNDSYFWQFRGDNNTVVPHYVTNGSPAAYGTTVSVPANAKAINGNTFTRIKLQIIGNTVTTYVQASNGNGFVEINRYTLDKGMNYGSIGFRTGRTESGSVDNIKVYKVNSNGEVSTGKDAVLFETDFADGVNLFSVGTVANGALSIGTGIGVPSILSAINLYPDEAAMTSLAAAGNFIFARDSFTLNSKKTLEKAIVSVTAKKPDDIRQFVYDLYVNGKSVGVGPTRFDTDPIDGSGILYFNTFDVTDKLRTGVNQENVIGAICYTTSEKRFLCQVTAFYTDGSSEVITNSGDTADGWKTKDGTNAFGDNGTSIGTSYFTTAAQNINAYAWPQGWNNIGYAEDTSWLTPLNNRENIVGTYDLSPYPADNTLRYDIKPASVTNRGKGTYFIDMGKEIVGGFGLKNVTADAAQTIEIHYGEELNTNGSVKHVMRTGNTYLEKWTLKRGTQSLENQGLMTYRYVEILNCPVNLTVENVKGVALRQKFSDEEASFVSSDALLNQIYDMTKYSIKATNQDLMVDSQSRERGAYEGDVLINALSSYSFEDDYALARFSNDWLITHRTWPAEYVLFTVINAWNDYLYTGDLRSLEEYYNILGSSAYNRRALYSGNLNSTYNLLRYQTSGQNTTDAVLVDWPNSETDGFQRTEYNTVMNAVAYGAYCDMASIAEVLGKTQDQKYWKNLADTIKSGMIKNLYDAAKGAFKDGVNSSHYSQHATAFALAYGVYDSQEMAGKMAAYIESQGEIRTSVYGSLFLLQGLYNAGRGDVAMDLMTSSGIRSWDHMINDLGATISTEAWDPKNKDNMTFSHPWGSAPGSQIVRGMFGIQPTSAGFKTFQVKFQPGDVKNASIKVPTVKGSIEASYVKDGGSFTSTIIIPANAIADVYVPVLGNVRDAELLVDGKAAEIEKTQDGRFLKTTLASGNHTLSLNQKKWISYFTFDDTENGFKNDYAIATPNAGVKLQEHEDGKALYLDGVDDFLNVTAMDGSSLLTSVEEMTISFQAKPNASNTNWGFFAAPNANAQTYLEEKYIGVLVRTSDIQAERYKNSGERAPMAAAASANSDWQYITVVHTQSEMILYINGAEVSRQSSEHSLSSILGNFSVLQIGKGNWGTGEYYSGLIDNYAIANYAMTQQEVVELIANGGVHKELPFTDVAEADWFYKAVYNNYFAELMTGTTPTTFAPFENLTRAQFACVLYRMENEPKISYSAEFADVPEGEWYTDAVLWAKENNIVTGYEGTNKFGSHDNISREQITVMMYRYAKFKGYNVNVSANLSAYTDAEKVSGYAESAIKWAVGSGIISGKSNGTIIDPQGDTLRAECAVIINNFMENM